jgi:serine/threonine protein kinase
VPRFRFQALVLAGKLYAGPEVDVWSTGVILYALLCGSLPFDDENIPNLFKKIKQGMYSFPNYLTPGARDLIRRMLIVQPLERITIPEIRQHPWFAINLPRYLAVMQVSHAHSIHSSPFPYQLMPFSDAVYTYAQHTVGSNAFQVALAPEAKAHPVRRTYAFAGGNRRCCAH